MSASEFGSCRGAGSVGGLVARAADALLAQCQGFVRGLPQRAYEAESRVIKGGSIGKHVRHVLDHYGAIFLALDTGEPITYDRRERHVPMETSPAAALEAIAELRRRVGSSTPETLGAGVRVRVMLSADGTEAELGSTVGRELAFATHHAIHHNAMMKAIAQEFGQGCDPGFGKAPSTLNFEGKECAIETKAAAARVELRP